MQDIVKYQAKPGYVSRKIAGEVLLVPIGEQTQELNGLVHLNETSEFLWDLLKSPHSIKELVDEIKMEFDVKDFNIENDVKEFIEKAISNNLIIEIKGEE